MMRRHKLCLLLLLSIFTLSMDKIYKSFHKYEYLYETESLNALNGAVNGPRVSCKVEIRVPGPCSYIIHTSECAVSEVTDVNSDGKMVFGSAVGTDNFKAEMEKYPLKFTVERDDDIKLFPEEEELVNILNIKRGIISALAVPVLEEKMNKDTPTIYGLCKTDFIVNSREKIATDVTLNRDLSKCDKFRPVNDHTSPLALITGTQHCPLAQLIRSTQTCNYKFDSEKHHMTTGVCTERHLLVPFSHKGEFGVTNIGIQTVTLLGVTKHNDRVFNHKVANMKPLHPDSSVDMSPVQDKEDALAVVRELAQLSKSKDGHKRAHLAHKLIGTIRRMNAETLAAAVGEALEISQSLTYQALLQCGTPECNRVIMGVFRTFDRSSAEIDAAVYTMGLMPRPSRVLVREMLEMAKFKPSKPVYYAVSNAVRRLYDVEGVTSEIQSVAAHVLEQIGDCTGDQEHIFLSLKVIGNMAVAMEAASPALMSAVIRCINQPVASPAVQRAAVQVYRQIPVPEQGREVLMSAVLDRAAVVQKRVAAYLILMKDPTSAELSQVAEALRAEENLQTKSFIISHMSNILSSTAPETMQLKQKILGAFQSNKVGTLMDPTKFSRFYKMGSLEGNMIFESPEELPRELMLEMTLDAFGFYMDLVEIGMEGKGFEPFIEALFGINGFFPDTAMKTIFYAANKIPLQVNDVLNDIVPVLRNDRRRRQTTQNIVQEIRQNVNKLFRELKAQDSPEALVYIRLLGAELGYLKTEDMEEMVNSAGNILFSSVDNDLFLHYVFMDNEFYLPTGSGFPLRVSLSGILTPGVKGGLSFNPDMGEFAFMPSVGIEFVTEVGAHFPDYVHSGLKMHTNIYHESGFKAKLSVRYNQVKLTVPAPQDPTKIISITNSLVSVGAGTSKTIPAVGERTEVECSRFFPGLKYCTVLQYSDAMSIDAAPYFPLNGDSKFAVELHSTGEVTEYTATISYEREVETDRVTVDVKAEGTSFEGTATLKLNRQTYAASVELLAPSLQLESKVSANIVKRAEELTVELECDLKLPETSSAQKLILKYDGKKIEAEVDSEVSSEIHNIINSDVEGMINSLLDYQILKNKMKIRDILEKSVKGLKVPVISFPKRLFLNIEGAAKYTFGEHYKTMTFHFPLGGKPTEEIFIPESVSLSLPSLGMAEVSGKLNSNFYTLEAAVTAERDAVAHTSYSANAEVTGTSSVDLLSLKIKGSVVVESTPANSFKANVKTTVNHKLVDVSVSVAEEVKLSKKISVESNSKLEVNSPVGVQISLEHTGQVGVNAEEISGDGNLEGSFKAGQVCGSGTLTQSVSLLPFKSEANIYTSLKTGSTLQARNTITAAFTNEGLSIQSNTALFEDLISNTAELTYNKSQLALKSGTKSSVFGLKIQNTAEARAGAEAASSKIVTSVDLSEERIYSQFTGTLDTDGLTVNSDASARLTGHTAAHKAILTINKDGLSSSGTASVKSLLTLEELQHTFDISYQNLTLNGKCRTTGGIMTTRLRHNTELEIAGLAGRFKNQIHWSTEDFHFETMAHGTAAPFRLNIDASAGAQGFIHLNGLQRVQFDTKAHLKAKPFAIEHSHRCRVSTTLNIDRGVSIQSKLENKFDTMITPAEQNATLTVKCKVNDYAINNELSSYNNPERLGLEGSGSIAGGLFHTQNLSISGFLKYDKKSDWRAISQLTFVSLPSALEDIRIALLRTVEALRHYINREDVVAKIQNLPQHVKKVVSDLNVEGRVVQLKHNLLALTQNMPEYILRLEDLEESLSNLRDGIETLVMEVTHHFSEELDILKQLMAKGVLYENVGEALNAVFSVIEEVKRLSIHAAKQLLTELDVIKNVNAIYGNARDSLSKPDGMIAAVLEEMVEHIKRFKNDETILVVLAQNVQSVRIQITQFLDDAITYLRTNDVRQVTHVIFIPPMHNSPAQISDITFGKLYGEIRVNSPVYSIRTSADVQDASDVHPRFTASVTSQGTSPYDVHHNLDFTAQMSIPEKSHLKLSETLKMTGFLICDQQATLTLIKVSPTQNPKAGTSASRVNTAPISIEDGTSYSIETDYNHQLSVHTFFLSNDVTLNQKALAYQEAATFFVKVTNEGSGKFAFYGFSDEGTHKSKLNFNMDLSTAKLALTGHTESGTMKIKMTANAASVPQSHFAFDARVETKSPFIKNSLLVASVKALLADMKVDIKAAHDTELVGDVRGFLTNAVNILARPGDVEIDFQNKGEISLSKSLSGKIELQNDYSVTLNPDMQRINTVALACFKPYYYSHNFTVINNKAETGIHTAAGAVFSPGYVLGQVIHVPIIGFKIPVVKDLIFEQSGQWDTFASTDQSIDLRAKLEHQKNRFAIPLGVIVSEMSFKSSLLELNATAGVFPEENILMGVNAMTASVFEELKVKLDGTTSVATKDGLKVSTSLSLDNIHIGGSHDGSLTLDVENYEAVMSADTTVKINLPTFSINATHGLSGDTKTHPKSTSALKIQYSFDDPDSMGVGHGDAENNLKMEATLSFISIESVTKGTTDSVFDANTMINGTLEKEATVFVNADGLQSSLKTTGNGIIVPNEDAKIRYDINNMFTCKGHLGRVYLGLEMDSNYEINSERENIKINHTAVGKSDIVPLSSFLSAVETILSPSRSHVYDNRDSETVWLDRGFKHKSKGVYPEYNSSLAFLSETIGEAPEVKLVFEGSYNLTSPSAILEYEFGIHSLVTSPGLDQHSFKRFQIPDY
ncbi:putative apolipoprotein B-100 [Triplophysa rosa]|uniref:Apolipoprotein B-100 n=1 Tax=Triplophysa rosa TaxID=992332 RepID=A0A9W7TMH1_TRIRA|nr:putative apolipoprotein B-100 [Triplophysa rosa]